MRVVAGREDGSHGLALLLGSLVVVAWAALLLVTLETGGRQDERTGALLAVFPRGIGETEVLARVARADGAVIGGTWFGNVWHVYGEQGDFARDLRLQGAVYVLPMLPFAGFGMGGCG
jgi:hypothetical protein